MIDNKQQAAGTSGFSRRWLTIGGPEACSSCVRIADIVSVVSLHPGEDGSATEPGVDITLRNGTVICCPQTEYWKVQLVLVASEVGQ